jgi:hypothetical protein
MEEEPTELIFKDNTSKEVHRASKEADMAFEKAVGASEEAGKGMGERRRGVKGKGEEEEERVDFTTSSSSATMVIGRDVFRRENRVFHRRITFDITHSPFNILNL